MGFNSGFKGLKKLTFVYITALTLKFSSRFRQHTFCCHYKDGFPCLEK